jgi:hypothetical protein
VKKKLAELGKVGKNFSWFSASFQRKSAKRADFRLKGSYKFGDKTLI